MADLTRWTCRHCGARFVVTTLRDDHETDCPQRPTGDHVTKTTTTDDLLEIESHARRLVWEIRDLYHELPDTIAAISGLHAICYDRCTPTKKRTTLAD